MLFALLIACQSAEPSWKGLVQPVETSQASECPPCDCEGAQETAPAESGFGDKKPQICIDDPFACDSDGNLIQEEPEPTAEPTEPARPVVTETIVEATPEPAAPPPPPVGMATQAAWGVRLLETLPNAQPPRAAIGLPDGTEIVVAPGSMLPEPGIVVISVGPDRAQLAKVSAVGDHAEIETLTLFTQY
ncbi:MAG: hypothetical protein VX899_03720 [Myxococcota bacterium]|nr:hypothetical protein [Myxococcota bacterium]